MYNVKFFLVAPRAGLEPTTYSLTGNRSTIELSGNGVSSQNRTDINGFADHYLAFRSSTQN